MLKVVLNMIPSLNFTPLFTLVLCAFISTLAMANTELSNAEADTIIKEDIAAAQVMIELCPALVGSKANIEQKVQVIIQTYLTELSDKHINYTALQKDTEYQAVLEQARQDMQQTSGAEQNELCLELANS
jgi:hypothetical protein